MKKKTTYYSFKNKDNKKIQLRGDLTIGDLLRMGFSNIGLVAKNAPYKKGEFRSVSN